MENSQKDCRIRLVNMQFCQMLPNSPPKGLYGFAFPSAICEHTCFPRASPQIYAKFWSPHVLCLYRGRDRYIQATISRTHPLLNNSTADTLCHVFPGLLQQPPISSYALISTQQPGILQKDHFLFINSPTASHSLRIKSKHLPQSTKL